MKNTKSLVFVYGTLKEGERNYDRYLNVSGAVHIFDASTIAHFNIVSAGSVSSPGKFTPSVIDGVKNSGYSIQGQVFEVTLDVLAELDRLEGISDGKYARKETEVMDENGQTHSVIMYFKTQLPENQNPDNIGLHFDADRQTANWHEPSL